MNKTIAKLNYLRITPRKIRLVADLIRNKPAQEAINQLHFNKKRAAKPVLKLLQSAIANAKHNHQLDEKKLIISKILVGPGPTLKRSLPRAMGRADLLRKRTSHITIELKEKFKK